MTDTQLFYKVVENLINFVKNNMIANLAQFLCKLSVKVKR